MAKQGQELRKFVAPEFVYGFGARSMSAQYAVNMGLKRPLLVTDAGVTDAGWTDDVRRTLEQAGLEVVVFDRVTPNPQGYEVEAGVAVYREETCDGIVAVGGGSPIDCAKGIGIAATNGDAILEYEGIDEVFTPIPPLICTPTTAGTGADLSQFAIIGDTRRKTKIAIVSKAVVPDVALVDPETTFTMDRELTANTGMDALTHALEALVSNASSDITSLHALEACKLVFQHLRTAAKEPEDRTAREGMM
ncbi:iron-containing alcohol dehydrogenase, partial [bacterium]|nr:iron-containing alcohol dehydrogenase [bacterium]